MRRTTAEMASAFLMRNMLPYAEALFNNILPVGTVSTVGVDDLPTRMAPISVGVRHTGGSVAGGGMERWVNPRLFAGAARTADLRLRDDEVPIIAQRGETVLPAGATLPRLQS